MHRHTDGADVVRPNHGTLARHKYDLLALEEPASNAAVELQEFGYDHEATVGTGRPDMRETETGHQNGSVRS